MNCFLTIDPGKRGAAVLWRDNLPVKIISFYHTKEWWLELYWLCVMERPDYVIKERVHGISGQGLSTTEVLVRHDSISFAVISILGIPMQEVEPQAWHLMRGVPKFHDIPEETKRRTERNKWLKAQALERYPDLKSWDKPIENAWGKLTKKGNLEKETPDIWAAIGIGDGVILQSNKELHQSQVQPV